MKAGTLFRAAGFLVALSVLLFLLGVASVNYSGAAVLILGAILFWPITRILRFARKLVGYRRWIWVLLAVLSILILCGFLGLVGGLLGIGGPLILIDEYYVTIERSGLQSHVFTIRESVGIDPRWIEWYKETDIPPSIDLPERQVVSVRAGLLVREVRVAPLQSDSSGHIKITLNDGRTLTGSICTSSCQSAYVELRDFPKNSFLAAKDGKNLQTYPYVNTETVSWSVLNLRRGIVFAFIPPPFHYIKPVIEPFLGASSLNHWVLGFLGLIGTAIITPIVTPVMLPIIQDKLRSRLEQGIGAKPEEGSKKKARIIVSSTGQEKEVDVSEKKAR